MTIEFIDLRKSYGKTEVLHGINFTLNKGRPLAFLGRNGAGKTTTIRGIMDVFHFDKGEIRIDGNKFKVSDYKIGYLPEERGMYGKVGIMEQLLYFSALRGVNKSAAKKSITELLERVELSEYANKKLETLSKGNQQKVQLIQAMMNDPEILILDEPFSGLDPVNSKILEELVLEVKADDKYLIFSSHQMSYVDNICDDLVIINHGDIALSGEIDQIKKDMGNGRINIVHEEMDSHEFSLLMKDRFSNIDVEIINDKLILNLGDLSKKEFYEQLIKEDIKFKTVGNYEPSMYDIFIETLGGKDNV